MAKRIVSIILAIIVVLTLAVVTYAQVNDTVITEHIFDFRFGTGEAMTPCRAKSNNSPMFIFCTSSPYCFYAIPCGATSPYYADADYMGAMTNIIPGQMYHLPCNDMFSRGYTYAFYDAWGQGSSPYTAITMWSPDSQ